MEASARAVKLVKSEAQTEGRSVVLGKEAEKPDGGREGNGRRRDSVD